MATKKESSGVVYNIEVVGANSLRVVATNFDEIKKKMQATSDAAVQVIKSMSGFGPQYKKAADNITTYKVAVEQATKAQSKFNSTTELFATYIVGRLLSRAIGNLLGQFSQAIDKALEFEKRIAEIQTISQKANLSFETWVDSTRQLSDAFGVDVVEVARATYEALSNQVVSGGDSFIFMSEALKFAQTTVSTAGQSVDLLTSAINAYGLSSLHAESVSKSFFALIEVGRVTATQLGNVFGTTANLASTLGIKLDELNTGLAMLTSQGTLPNTALTLFSNVILKLIKPSTEMTSLLQKWGVSSGQAAIATYGFSGVLKLLGKELESGGLARIADLEKDIRAIRGVSGLLTETAIGGFEQYEARINASKAAYEAAAKIIKDPEYYKYSQELTKIANVLTTDFGRKGIAIMNSFNAAMGGTANMLRLMTDTLYAAIVPFKLLADAMARCNEALKVFHLDAIINIGTLISVAGAMTIAFFSVKALGLGLVALVAKFTALTGITLTVSGGFGLLTAAMGMFAGIAATTTATVGTAIMVFMPYLAILAAVVAAIAALYVAWGRSRTRNMEEVVQKDTDHLKLLAANAVKEGAAFDKAMDEKTQKVFQVSAAINKALEKQSGKGNDNLENYLKSLNDKLEDTIRIIGELENSFAKRNRETREFGLTFRQELVAIQTEFSTVQAALQKSLANDDWLDNVGKIRDLFSDARKEAEALNNNINKAIEANEKYLKSKNQSAEERKFDLSLKGPGDKEAMIEAEVRRLLGTAASLTDPEELKDTLNRAQELAEKVTEISEDRAKQMAKFGGSGQVVQSGLEQDVLNAQIALIGQMNADLNGQKIDEKVLQTDRLNFEAAIKGELDGRIAKEKAISDEIARQNKMMAEMLQLKKEMQDKQRALKEGNIKDIEAVTGALQEIERKGGKLTGINLAEYVDAIKQQAEAGQLVVASSNLSGIRERASINKDNDSQQVMAQVRIIETIFDRMFLTKESLKEVAQPLAEFEAALEQHNATWRQQIQNFPSVLKELDEAAKQNIKTEGDRLLDLINKMKLQAGQGAVVGAGQLGPGFAMGGLISGQGTDNKTIRASGGEFMMNPAATERNFPALVAMNSGRFTFGGAGGGGDTINQTVNVKEAQKPQQTAIAAARALRRLGRQRAIRLTS